MRNARRKLSRDRKTQGAARAAKRSVVRAASLWGLVALGIAGTALGIIALGGKSSSEFDVTRECVTHSDRLGLHIHPHLSIYVNGRAQLIPAEVGIPSANCMRPVHTHDASGTLHVEWPTRRSFTLGDFFKLWEVPFSRDQVLGHRADPLHAISVTVNGVANDDYERLVLKDEDRIVIQYRRR